MFCLVLFVFRYFGLMVFWGFFLHGFIGGVIILFSVLCKFTVSAWSLVQMCYEFGTVFVSFMRPAKLLGSGRSLLYGKCHKQNGTRV